MKFKNYINGFIGLYALSIIASGCSPSKAPPDPKKELDERVAHSFKLYKNTSGNYRVCIDEAYIKDQNDYFIWDVAVPSFKDRFVRSVYNDNGWSAQIPIGTYHINGLEVIVHGRKRNFSLIVGNYDKNQYIRIKNKDFFMDCNIENKSVCDVSLNGKTYSQYNPDELNIVAFADSKLKNILPKIDSIDNDEISQYLAARKRYLDSRNDSVNNQIRNIGL